MVGKPYIIFLAGLWCRQNIWDKWAIAAQQAGHMTHTIDFVPKGDIEMALPDMVKYIKEECWIGNEFGGGMPVIIGHSMGGLIAQAVAAEFNLSRIVLLHSAAPRGISNLTWSLGKKMLPYTMDILRGNDFTPRDQDALDLIFNNCPESLRTHPLLPSSGLAARQIMTGTVSVPKILCPCLVIGGQKDRLIPLSVQRQLANKYNRHSDDYWEVPYGHMPMLEDTDNSLIERILHWIS